MRRLFVICYDISNDKTRRVVEKKLLRVGLRVQYSVFECLLTPAQFDRLRAEVKGWLDPDTDAVHYFQLCKHCVSGRMLHGKALPKNWQSYEFVG